MDDATRRPTSWRLASIGRKLNGMVADSRLSVPMRDELIHWRSRIDHARVQVALGAMGLREAPPRTRDEGPGQSFSFAR